jgi:Secretion system C-terminal sorting domain
MFYQTVSIMKRQLLVALIICGSATIHAQIPSSLLPSVFTEKKPATEAITRGIVHRPMIQLNYNGDSPNNDWNFLDSVLYEYDSQGVKTAATRKNLISPLDRRLYTTTTDSLIELLQFYDQGTWVDLYKAQYYLDVNGSVMERVQSIYNQSNAIWDVEDAYLYTRTYNAQNHLIEYIVQDDVPNSNPLTYVNSSRYVYAYYPNGITLQNYVQQSWDGVNWVPVQRFEFDINGAGEVYQWFIKDWDAQSATFVNSQKITDVVYDDWNGDVNTSKVASYQLHNWNLANSVYELNERTTITYGIGDGYVALFELYDGVNWTNSRQVSFVFDQDGNQTLNEFLEWIPADSDWRIIEQDTFLYDVDGKRLQMLDISWDDLLLEVRNNWREDYVDYVAFDDGLGVTENTLESLLIYPNPTSGYAEISDLPVGSESVLISDLSGKIRKTIRLTGENNASVGVDLSNMNQGMYLVLVQQADKTIATGKLLLK